MSRSRCRGWEHRGAQWTPLMMLILQWPRKSSKFKPLSKRSLQVFNWHRIEYVYDLVGKGVTIEVVEIEGVKVVSFGRKAISNTACQSDISYCWSKRQLQTKAPPPPPWKRGSNARAPVDQWINWPLCTVLAGVVTSELVNWNVWSLGKTHAVYLSTFCTSPNLCRPIACNRSM